MEEAMEEKRIAETEVLGSGSLERDDAMARMTVETAGDSCGA